MSVVNYASDWILISEKWTIWTKISSLFSDWPLQSFFQVPRGASLIKCCLRLSWRVNLMLLYIQGTLSHNSWEFVLVELTSLHNLHRLFILSPFVLICFCKQRVFPRQTYSRAQNFGLSCNLISFLLNRTTTRELHYHNKCAFVFSSSRLFA